MSRLKRVPWKVLAALVVLGAGAGGFLAFGPPQLMAKTETPLFCSSCHVMESQYEAWFHVGAHRSIRCVDCHLPHQNLPVYYVWKTIDGMKDVVMFHSGQVPETIELSKRGRGRRAGELRALPLRTRGDDRPGPQLLGLPSLPSAPTGGCPPDQLNIFDRNTSGGGEDVSPCKPHVR